MGAVSGNKELELLAEQFSLNAAGRFDSGAPPHEPTIAVNELLSCFDEDESEGHWETIMAYADIRASKALLRAAESLGGRPVHDPVPECDCQACAIEERDRLRVEVERMRAEALPMENGCYWYLGVTRPCTKCSTGVVTMTIPNQLRICATCVEKG